MNAPRKPTAAEEHAASLAASGALEALRRTEAPAAPRARRRWGPRVTVLLLVLGGLAAVYGLVEPLLFPPRVVRLVDVQVAEAGASVPRAIAEAAGWIEADPYPTTVRPLVKGTVARYGVVEAQAVKAGETVIAVLRNPDLENALVLAEADLAVREADVARAEAVLAVGRAVLEQRLPQRTEVRRLEGEREVAKAALEAVIAEEGEAVAALERARVESDAQETLLAGGAQVPIARETARRRLEEARAARQAAQAERLRGVAEVARVEALLALAVEGRDDPRELAGRVAEQQADAALATAERDRARVAVEVARRNVDLLTVRAPTDGVVMRLLSAPGSVAGPMEQMRSLPSEAEGTTSTSVLDAMVGGLAILYDPARLQARIDVPFQDVPQVGVGTEAEVAVPALPGRSFRGEVSRVVHEANILKATLQVKVRLLETDPAIRPEMLAKARFLVKGVPATGPAASVALVPTEAVRGDAVFLLDPTRGGRARRVPVRVLGRRGDRTEVEGPLGLSSRVILDPVEDGERVRGDR